MRNCPHITILKSFCLFVFLWQGDAKCKYKMSTATISSHNLSSLVFSCSQLIKCKTSQREATPLRCGYNFNVSDLSIEDCDIFLKRFSHFFDKKRNAVMWQMWQPRKKGGRSWGSVVAALPERSGSFTKGRTPNIRYFVAKRSIVAIYARFERILWSFQRRWWWRWGWWWRWRCVSMWCPKPSRRVGNIR